MGVLCGEEEGIGLSFLCGGLLRHGQNMFQLLFLFVLQFFSATEMTDN